MASALELHLYTTLHNPWRCSVYQATLQSVASATLTKVTFDTVTFDPLTSYNTGTHQYTVPQDGYYQMTATVQFANIAVNYAYMRAFLNNTTSGQTKGGHTLSTINGGGGTVSVPTVTVTGLMICHTGDLVEADVQQNTAGSVNTTVGQANTYLDIHWVGPL